MLTDTQVQVLAATNDHCEVHGPMNVGTGEIPLPDLLADLEMPEQEVWQAPADLHELGLIKGTTSFGARAPDHRDGSGGHWPAGDSVRSLPGRPDGPSHAALAELGQRGHRIGARCAPRHGR